MTTIARPGARAVFAVRSFRFQWPADLVTSWAFEMETLILGWFVLVETGSVLALTLFASLQFLGTLFAPMFGVVGDRIGHRNLLCGMRATYLAFALVLAALALADTLEATHVFVIGTLAGIVRPSDLVMRNSLVGETMPPAFLMTAMGISRTTADSARIAGALAGAGVVAALGMGPAYAVIAALYATSFALTLGVASARPGGAASRASPWRDLREAASYVRTTPHLLAAMCLAFLINFTALPLTGGLLPYVARDVYGMGQAGLGYLSASFALGALLGSLALSRIGGAIRPARTMLAASVIWYGLLFVYAAVDDPSWGIPVLVAAGLMQSFSLVTMAVMLLRNAAAPLRGRVMGLRMLAVYGMPLGLLAAGPLIERIGFAAMATLYGSVGLALTILIALRWRAHLWPAAGPANAR
ncbi:MAG: MFS transporter [Alphaproteobacteria bacterium]